MKSLGQRDCWIFDMDGTLTVSMHDFEDIRRQLGLAPGEPILELLAAMPAAESAPLHQRLDDIEFEVAARAKAGAGVETLLRTLLDRGVQIGIVTRNGQQIAYETLRACGLLHYFDADCVIGREQALPKPEPDGILQLLDKWQLPPERAVMVGDYYFDLAAGRAAGTATVYLDVTGRYEWADYADVSVERLDELVEFLD
jgi:HAD superfamily hydrolase (TIGR01509 family)